MSFFAFVFLEENEAGKKTAVIWVTLEQMKHRASLARP